MSRAKVMADLPKYRPGGYHVDALVALLTVAAVLFYIIAPAARLGMLLTFFVPVCVSGFYVGAKRSTAIAIVCTLTVSLAFVTGGVPGWPQDTWTCLLTVLLWTVSLGCCSVCVSGISELQVIALDRMREQHVNEQLVDGLTGLKNRLAFDYEFRDQLNRRHNPQWACSLLMIDVDFFKKFNDRYGHKAGDFVLREVAEVLNDLTREGDIVARFGGEEFVVLMPDTDMQVAQAAAERIRSSIEKRRFVLDGTTMRLTVSIGIADRSNSREPGDSLLDRADAALYASKHAGRNCVHYHSNGELLPFGATLALYENDENRSLDQIAADCYLEEVTGLPHRKVFQEELKRRIAEAARYEKALTVAFIRLVGYEEIIRLGVEAESDLLAILAERLRGCLRDCDLGTRTGRSEFAVMLPDTTLENAAIPVARIERVLTKCGRSVVRGANVKLETVVGAAQSQPCDDVTSLTQRAREAADNGCREDKPQDA